MTVSDALAAAQGAGAATAAEIASQPQLWPEAVDAGLAASELQQRLIAGTTIYTGCGSTAHLARALAVNHLRTLSTFAWAEVASEFWLSSSSHSPRPQTMVAVSRSGETTETIEACKRAEMMGSTLVTVTTCPESTLADIGHVSVLVDFAAEESVVQTRSFTCMLLAVLAAQLSAAGKDASVEIGRIAAAGEILMAETMPIAECLADQHFDTIYVLGSSFDGPLASEGALKIKEMSATFTEGLGILDFRHGPITLADKRTAALVLCGGSLAHELAVAADIEACGSRVFTVGPDPQCSLETPRGATELEIAVSRLVVPQVVGLQRGIAKGIDPDAPQGVLAYVEL